MLDFTDNADSALLDRQTVKVVTGDLKVEGEAEIKLELAPVPGVYLDGVFNDPRLLATMTAAVSEPHSMYLLDKHDQRIEGGRAESSWNRSTLKLRWRLLPEPIKVVGDDDTRMTQLIAYVFNLDTRLWRPAANTMGALELEHGAWKGRIRMVEHGSAGIWTAGDEGGCRLTHIVEFGQDGGQFNGGDADKLLQAMRNILTFVNGRMCDLTCPSGRDDTGDEVWARWSSPYQWRRTHLSWLDRRDGEPLAELFPGFMDRWAMDGWEDALRTAIWWYAQANSGSAAIDQGIVTSQIAMERLAYEYCVCERTLVSKGGFKKLDAADRYRLLLSSLDIPITMPSAAKSLGVTSKAESWTDSPQALTEIRNNLVHAGRKGTKLDGDGYLEAWSLAVGLLELTILALCNFKSEYWNRLHSAKEPAPWTQ